MELKEKLMKALKTAAADYNNGMSADLAVACNAEAWDFNEKQAERLTEMFNTALALNKQKDADDPAGTCELASKEAVAKILLDRCGRQKSASACAGRDYSFYSGVPERTSGAIEARAAGLAGMSKAASSEAPVPDELKVSQRSLLKIISGKIDFLKSAASAADDVARNLKLEVERDAIKIAKAIEDPFADPELADMFKAACANGIAVGKVAAYSTKVAESDGGRFARANVFDAGKAEPILKIAKAIDENAGLVPAYERKRDFYMSKAAEAEDEMMRAVGLVREERKESLADMFVGSAKKASAKEPKDEPVAESAEGAGLCMKIAGMLRESGAGSEQVARLAEELEKDAAMGVNLGIPVSSAGELYEELSKRPRIDDEKRRVLNVRRSILLADLMSNDPIIRDADPNVVTEAYKTMVMSSPRVSLDKAQVRAFLRSAANSVAISPADAKMIGDVDRLVSSANVDRLTQVDSSIKDSNV